VEVAHLGVQEILAHLIFPVDLVVVNFRACCHQTNNLYQVVLVVVKAGALEALLSLKVEAVLIKVARVVAQVVG
jgi:hypothetical protein